MPIIGAVIGAVAGIGGALISGGAQKRAAQQAADAQTNAAQLSIAEQQRQYDQTRADNMPFLQAGTDALGQERGLLGLNGNDQQQTSIDALRASPLYQSLYRNGNEAALANASATGGLRGGNAQHSFYNLGEDTLTNVIQSQLANLGSLRTGGQNVGNFLGQAGAAKAGAVGDALTQQGAAQSGGILAKSAIGAQTTNNLFSSLGLFLNNPNVQSGLSGLFNKPKLGYDPSVFHTPGYGLGY
jgi:hypothetical protein